MTHPPDGDDLYSKKELAEIDELNRMTDDQPSFFQSRWWKRSAIGFALMVVVSMLLPVFLLLQDESSPSTPEPPSPLQVPDFELAAAQGGTIRLSEAAAANSAVVLVFYRGYF